MAPTSRPTGPRGASPRPGAAPARRRRGLRRLVPTWKVVVGALLTLVLLGGGGFAVAYAMTDVPEPTEFGQKASTTVYYSDGTTELGTFADVNRTPVPAQEIPDTMEQAIIAAEDRSFYDNRGVSPTGIARAFWSNLQGNATQGGSTITQQYVKNYYTGDDSQSVARKAREAFIALKIDQEQSKDEILANYLNTIYFGRGAYGVQEAAQAYFAVDVGELTTSQAALLAGVVPSPSTFDPAVSPGSAQDRWDYVMDGLVVTGALTQAERDAEVFPEVVDDSTPETYAGPDGHLLQAVRDELTSRGGFTDEELDGGGLGITTTFDAQMQEAAVAAMEDEDAYPSEDRPETVHAGLVSIDPATGAVRALYGGADYLERQQSAATDDIAQAGSTFKPFTLVAALEDGISLDTTYSGRGPQYFDEYLDEDEEPVEVRNFGGQTYGWRDLVGATEDSINTIYVPLNIEVGPERTREVAERAGLPADTAGLGTSPSNVLGTASPHVMDMAHAYATFAAQGVRTIPHVVQEVTQGEEVRYTGDTTGERVFEEDVMADLTYALSQVVEEGSGDDAQELDRDVAGKTGTSNDIRSAWFTGYTPQLATAVSVFAADPETGAPIEMEGWGGVSNVTGSSFPLRIWTEYMDGALDGAEELDFPDRAYVGSTSRSSDEDDDEPTSTPTQTRSDDDDGEEEETSEPVETTESEPEPTRSETQTAEPEPSQPVEPEASQTETQTPRAPEPEPSEPEPSEPEPSEPEPTLREEPEPSQTQDPEPEPTQTLPTDPGDTDPQDPGDADPQDPADGEDAAAAAHARPGTSGRSSSRLPRAA